MTDVVRDPSKASPEIQAQHNILGLGTLPAARQSPMYEQHHYITAWHTSQHAIMAPLSAPALLAKLCAREAPAAVGVLPLLPPLLPPSRQGLAATDRKPPEPALLEREDFPLSPPRRSSPGASPPPPAFEAPAPR